jgi:hypothetical protein
MSSIYCKTIIADFLKRFRCNSLWFDKRAIKSSRACPVAERGKDEEHAVDEFFQQSVAIL